MTREQRMDKLGNTIKKARKGKGLTQKDLAKAIGRPSRTSISEWETGRKIPNALVLIDLMNCLHLKQKELCKC